MNTISNERLESLQRQFREEGFNDIRDSEVMQLVEENLALRKEHERAEHIVKTAEKLVRCKGRYHSEQNYRTLAELFGVTTPDLPPLETDTSAQQFESLAGKVVVPAGWKLVPIEPTMQQEYAGYKTLNDTGKMSRLMKTRLGIIYRAMLSAAPEPCK